MALAIPQTMRDDEIETLNRMRNRVLYEGYKNSLVEWTLSEDWYTPPSKHWLDVRGETIEKYYQFGRIVRVNNKDTNGVSFGEIDAH